MPYEDHAAQLEQMKAMMEQMRLEKEQMRLEKERLETEAKRYETEVKRKEEEEAAALRKEQEREMALKEKKELDAVFSLFRDATNMYYPAENAIDYMWRNAGEEESKFLRSLEASGETILLASVDPHARGCQSHRKPQSSTLRFVLTNCHLYDCVYKWTSSKCEHCKSDNSLKLGSFYASTLYSFTNPLQIAHAKILSSIMTIPTIGGGPTRPYQSLWIRVESALANTREGGLICETSLSKSLKKFESVIRLIPGSYKNGDWKQLDGFFGMYFNETTMELSEVPPPSL